MSPEKHKLKQPITMTKKKEKKKKKLTALNAGEDVE